MSTYWHPTRECAYRAVEMVSQGKCAAQIARALFGRKEAKNQETYDSHRNIMRVERLLRFARETGILVLRSDTNEELQMALAALYDQRITFHVVNNVTVRCRTTGGGF